MNAVWYFTFLAFALLSACSDKQVPLKGKREPILVSADIQEAEADNAFRALELGAIQDNNGAWPFPYAAESNVMPRGAAILDVSHIRKAFVVHAFSQSGAVMLMPPVVAKGLLFFVAGDGSVVCVDAQTGALKWHMPFEESTEPLGVTLGGGCAFSKGRLYIGHPFGFLACLDAYTGRTVWKIKTEAPLRGAPMVHAHNKSSTLFTLMLGGRFEAYNAFSGKPLWVHASVPEKLEFLGGSMPALCNDGLVVGYSSGEVYRLNSLTGRSLWSYVLTSTLTTSELDQMAHIVASPVVYRGHVYVVAPSDKMIALDYKTGDLLWERSFGGFETPFASGRELFIVTRTQIKRMDRLSGKVSWSLNLKELCAEKEQKKNAVKNKLWYGPLLRGKQLYVLSEEGDLWALDAETGEKRSLVLSLKEACAMRPLMVGKKLYILTKKGALYAFHVN